MEYLSDKPETKKNLIEALKQIKESQKEVCVGEILVPKFLLVGELANVELVKFWNAFFAEVALLETGTQKNVVRSLLESLNIE